MKTNLSFQYDEIFKHSLLNNRNIVLSILFLALIIRVINIIIYNYPLQGDEQSYNLGALNLALGNGYAYTPDKYISGYPILYSLILSPFYYLFGHNLLIPKIINIIMGVTSCWLTYILAKEITKKNSVAILSMLAMAINPEFVRITGKILSENLITPLMLIWMFILIIIWNSFRDLNSYSKKIVISILSGILYGLILLTKSITSCFFPVFAWFFLFSLVKIKIKNRFIFFIFACIGISLAITPWAIRNYIVYDKFIPLTAGSSGVALYTSYIRKGQPFGNVLHDDFSKGLQNLSQAETDKKLTQYTFKYIQDNPSIIPKLILQKTGYFWGPLDWEIMSVDGYSRIPGYNFIYMFIIPFFIFGLFYVFKSYKENFFSSPWFLIILQIFSIYGICLIFYGSARFRMTIEPLIIIFSIHTLNLLFIRTKSIFKNKILKPIIFCYLAINFIIFINIQPIIANLKKTSWIQHINFYSSNIK
ncbi:MAG: glycosyltransferase family 39 protein [Oligoflexia bacterium]|nr:glycosyltransferase family 39 protein [Oligoflexia bacterium]